MAQRLVHIRTDRVDQGHRANFDGFLAHDLVAQGGRDLMLIGTHQLQFALELLGWGDRADALEASDAVVDGLVADGLVVRGPDRRLRLP